MPHTFTFLIALLLSTVASAQGSFSAPIFLRCEYLDNPLGIDVVRPRLSWVLIASEAELRGQRQAAYQILVASSLERLVRDEGDLWDSGKVVTPSLAVSDPGRLALSSGAAIHWPVQSDACSKPIDQLAAPLQGETRSAVSQARTFQ
jgi:alpha-L-rhamnosidase